MTEHLPAADVLHQPCFWMTLLPLLTHYGRRHEVP
jgi:hypothetical protein